MEYLIFRYEPLHSVSKIKLIFAY